MKYPAKIRLLLSAALLAITPFVSAADSLERTFTQLPDSARPWVYWYFQDGHLTREGMKADLEAMKKAGIGGALFLEIGGITGVFPGPVKFMSPEWQDLVVAAIGDCDRLGLEFSLGTGPGWCGAGGSWVKPDDAMQQIVGKGTEVVGPWRISLVLPQPAPREPFFGLGTLTQSLNKEWKEYYRDVAVIAYPTPITIHRLADADEKALYYRSPFTTGTVKSYLRADPTVVPPGEAIDSQKIIDLTDKLAADGTLSWDVPPGRWTIVRYGRTLTGQTTRPATQAGLGWETGKFETATLDAHFTTYLEPLYRKLGQQGAGKSWKTLHFDSWEMSAQNWSPTFRAEFKKRRGYDALRYLPAMQGEIVESVETTERFLWDIRLTAQELVIKNHAGRIKEQAAKHGMSLTIEPYDMNPSGDMALGDVADTPSAEFWSKAGGVNSDYSVFASVSSAHTRGKKVVQAEAFTSYLDAWQQHPGSMKEQGDWALCSGINRFAFHRYAAQTELDKKPGLPWGPYGVHWERTQTWWDLVPAYHAYVTRCQALLQRGLPVADVLYLDLEGAPVVFRPPASALLPGYPDRKGYNFDGCSPGTLIERASVKNGRIVFPDGMSYRRNCCAR
jgi:alpha-L-rhamnosidase